jgi:hypothetical protein
VAHLAWDSDELPAGWVNILNDQFDLCLFTTAYLSDVARRSGVTIDLGTMPVGIDIANLLADDLRTTQPSSVVFGSLSAFHPRKNLGRLLLAFAQEFEAAENVQLRLHSGLALGEEFMRVQSVLASLNDSRITVTHERLSEEAKNSFLRGLDIYVNVSAGEGYSIGPREALALGMPAVISQIPAHMDLIDIPGVTPVTPSGRMPATYPEVSNQAFGTQSEINVDDIRRALRTAFVQVLDGSSARSSKIRRNHAAQFDLETLSESYRSVFMAELVGDQPVIVESEDSLGGTRRAKLGRHGSRVGAKRLIVPVHDAGYFSIFNVFMANLVWNSLDRSMEMVVPDWRSDRLLDRLGGALPTSYCYSSPEQGNLWNLLYEPLYDLTPEEMNSEEFLSTNAVAPSTAFVEDREPLLTYINAYRLYRAPWFSQFRNQYHDVLRRHVRLLPEFRAQIDRLLPDPNAEIFRISAHVRHPSHAMEQPNGRMAGTDIYAAHVRSILKARGISESSDGWELFLATDNERAIRSFTELFGDHVRFVSETERVSESHLQAYDRLEGKSALAEGHQIQHINASDPQNWNHLKAFEVWRDAELLAASNVMLHAVSNVATAAAFINPRVEMVYCDPGE